MSFPAPTQELAATMDRHYIRGLALDVPVNADTPNAPFGEDVRGRWHGLRRQSICSSNCRRVPPSHRISRSRWASRADRQSLSCRRPAMVERVGDVDLGDGLSRQRRGLRPCGAKYFCRWLWPETECGCRRPRSSAQLRCMQTGLASRTTVPYRSTAFPKGRGSGAGVGDGQTWRPDPTKA